MRNELQPAADFLRRYFPDGGSVLCAVSGGLDSMCLLDFVSRQSGFSVTAAHFNHGLRGEFADRDEAFVRGFCLRRDIPFLSERGNTPALVEAEGLSVEEAARQLRYDFLQRAAARAGCSAILTAHHADDHAETMLLNLLRGTGSAGLAGIPPVRGNLFRPFLRISRRELEAYAARHDLPHVEDETNCGDTASRNVLRHKVLPVLQELNPQAVENMSRTASILSREHTALEMLAQQYAEQATETEAGLTFPREVLQRMPEALAERTVLLLLARASGHRKNLTAAHIESVLQIVRSSHSGLSASLPYALIARTEGSQLLLERLPSAAASMPLPIGQKIRWGSWEILCEALPDSSDASPSDLLLDAGKITAPLFVGVWDSRGRMQFGRGSRSLKRLFADHGISPSARDRTPVFYVGSHPVAVPGIGVDESFSAAAGHCAPVLRIKYQDLKESKEMES